MSDIQRGLVELLHDLDRRARPGRAPRNLTIQKFVTIPVDTVVISSDVSAVDGTFQFPMVWVGASTPSSCALTWSMGTWS